MVDGDSVSALGNDAGKTRDDESLERLAGLSDVHAVHFGDDAYPQRNRQFRACVCTVEYRQLVCGISGAHSRRMLRGLRKESRLSEERESTGCDRFARIELSL